MKINTLIQNIMFKMLGPLILNIISVWLLFQGELVISIIIAIFSLAWSISIIRDAM